MAALHSSFVACDNCLSVLSDWEEEFKSLTPSGSNFASYPVVTFLTFIFSPSKTPSNPLSPDETSISPLQSTNNPTTIIPGASPPLSTGLRFSILLPENDQSKTTDELHPLKSLLSDIRPLLSRANHLKNEPDQFALGRQHRREYYTNHARRAKRPRFSQRLQYSL